MKSNAPHQPTPTPFQSWYAPRKTALRFILLLLGLLIAFHVFWAGRYAQENLVPAYLRFWARSTAATLHLFGEPATAAGATVISPRFSVDILKGCDAIDPMSLFAAAVLAFPAGWRRKFAGLVAGIMLILALNLVRLVSLFYVGIHLPGWFDFAHYEFWQVAFILLAILCWGLWAAWALGEHGSNANAAR